MGKIEVLIVDDSPFIRRAVERMLEPLPDVEVVGSASNGREGVRMAESLRPDVVILDIVMPELDGLGAIEAIMERAPTAILVLSSEAQPGAETTLRALELGAVDFISKSTAQTRMDIYDLAPLLQERVLAIAGSRTRPALQPPAPAPEPAPETREAPQVATPTDYDIVAIGASTGGPRALVEILTQLPASFPTGIVVAQHMPPGFTSTLAERLDRRSPLRVREARDGDRVEPGLALVGRGGRQIRVQRNGRGDLIVRVPEEADEQIHRPSVDVLLRSVAEAAGERAVGLVLTGMGQDGARGLRAMRNAGARTLVESESSAVIYGMPKAAQPAADEVLDLGRIAGRLQTLVGGKGAV